MSLLSRLFGRSDSDADREPAEVHEGFAIKPCPIREGTQWRVSAQITKEIDGVLKTHVLVRADTDSDHDNAVQISLRKAKQVIDEQGDAIFR